MWELPQVYHILKFGTLGLEFVTEEDMRCGCIVGLLGGFLTLK